MASFVGDLVQLLRLRRSGGFYNKSFLTHVYVVMACGCGTWIGI